MVGKKFILSLFFFIIGLALKGQTYSYSYVDPCTGISNTIQLSSQSQTVTMFYGGFYKSFTYAELLSGGYETWVTSINSQAGGADPCAGNGPTITNNFNNILANNMTGNVVNITNIVSMAASLSNNISGAASTSGGISSSSSDNNSSSSNSNNTNSSTNIGGNSTNSGGNTGNSGGSGGNTGNSGGNGGNSGSGGSENKPGQNPPISGSNSGNNEPQSGQNVSETGSVEQGGALGEMNVTSASGGSSESSSGGGKKNNSNSKQGRGALIAAADLVIIRNDSLITKSGNDNLKINSSLTQVNTKQTLIKGVNLNYQTGVHILNMTLYGSYKHRNFMVIGSNSSMYDFKQDWFNTTSVLASQKVSKLTFMGGTNYTFGQLGKGTFGNWSIIGGGFTNFKGSKSFSTNIMLLGVYSPYIFYYDGQWYRSGILMIPLINTDFKVTDKFKLSISFAGTYQINSNVLNYQIATGTKMLL